MTPCCMSTVSESNPWWAITSAEKALGMESQPFTTASPRFQIVFSVFSRTSFSSLLGDVIRRASELGPAHRAEVAPPTDPQIFGLLEVGDGRDVRLRIREIGLHRPDREAELLADRLEPRVAPADPRHLGLAEIRLEEVHARRLDAEDVVSVERVATELEGRAVWGGTARLPVHERQAPLPRPETEVGRDPHRRALEVEDLRPMLDRPVLWRRLADFGEQRQAEEVPETGADVAAERLPRLGRQLDPVLVLEERRRFWILAVATRLGGAPLAPHPLDHVGDEGLDGNVAAAVGRARRARCDRDGPLLPRR